MSVSGSVVCRVVILLLRSKRPHTHHHDDHHHCHYGTATTKQSIKAPRKPRSSCTISAHGTRFVLGPGSTLALFLPSFAFAPCALAGPFYPWPLAPDPGPSPWPWPFSPAFHSSKSPLSLFCTPANSHSHTPHPLSLSWQATLVRPIDSRLPATNLYHTRDSGLLHIRFGFLSTQPSPNPNFFLHFLLPESTLLSPTTSTWAHFVSTLATCPISCTSLSARAITAKFVSSKFSFIFFRLRVVFGIRLETEFFTHSHSLPSSPPRVKNWSLITTLIPSSSSSCVSHHSVCICLTEPTAEA